MVMLEFAMAPGGKGESVSEWVARIIDLIDLEKAKGTLLDYAKTL